MPRPDHTDSFAAPAMQGPGGLWRPALGVALILFLLPALLIVALVGSGPDSQTPAPQIEPAAVMAFTLLFGALNWVWLAIVLALLHGQPLRSVLAPDRRIWPRHLWTGMLIAVVYTALSTLLGLVFGGEARRSGIELSDWIAWLPLLGGLVVLQASGEEAVFRGYLVQQIARRTRSRVLLILATSGLFGFLHIDPSFGEPQALAFMLLTFGFGAIACLMVIRTGSLSAAIGFHVAANWAALLVVGTELPERGVTSLWVFDGSEPGRLMLADGLALLATWLWLQSPLSPLLPAPAEA